MSIVNEIQKAHAEHDPHGFKNREVPQHKLHGHVNEPYVFQKFPMTVYKGKAHKTVETEEELEAAAAEGFTATGPDRSEEPDK
jgi:hypothetical protein